MPINRCGLCRLALRRDDPDILKVTSSRSARADGEACEANSHILQEDLSEESANLVFHQQCLALTSPAEACQKAHRRYPTTPHSTRLAWARSNLIKNLRTAFNRVPAARATSDEVWFIIAEQLLPQYLTTRALQLPDVSESHKTLVTLARPVYYKMVRIDHKSYISRISNEDLPGAFRADLRCGIAQELMYILHDDFGITGIIVSSDFRPPPVERVAGQWWTTLAISRSSELSCSGNELALRDVVVSPGSGKTLSLTLPYPSHQLRLERLHGDQELHVFDCFDCNRPEIIGYSACWNHGLVTIVTHKTGQSHDHEAMEGQAVAGSWLYAPVDVGETISEIWTKEGRRWPPPLAFKTSKNRSIILGPYPKHKRTRWILLDRPRKDGDRIFFDNGTPAERMAFSSESPAKQHSAFHVPSQVMHSRVLTSLETFFYSEASLVGVVELIPCHLGHAIRGIILSYDDGHQRALGEVRLDALTTSIRMDSLSPAGLQFAMKNGCFPYVYAISQGSSLEGIELAGSGVVKWWWSSRQCQVTLDNQESPKMCSANGGV